MTKPKRGQRVTHKNGQQGTVVNSSSSTTWVHFKGASKPVEVYSSQVSKTGGWGCLSAFIILAVPVTFLIGVIGYGSTAA